LKLLVPSKTKMGILLVLALVIPIVGKQKNRMTVVLVRRFCLKQLSLSVL
jgi:hypothetical protein